jgi:hypothetical protein
MASPYTRTALLGANLKEVVTAADLAAGEAGDAALGTQVWGSDGKQYVYAQANAAITASTAVCTVSASTFLATASGGSYTSPATTMASGDRGWFSKASV